MTQNLNNINESVLSKILKLKELADRGVDGEAINARTLLEKHLARYGLTLDDLTNPKEEIKEYSFRYGSDSEKTVILQCIINLFGTLSEEWKNVYRYRTGKMIIFIKTTPVRYSLLEDFINFHLNNYRTELKRMQINFLHSYLQKYDLFDKDEELRKANGNEAKHRKSKMDSLLDWAYIMKLQEGMGNAQYTKKIDKQTLRIGKS